MPNDWVVTKFKKENEEGPCKEDLTIKAEVRAKGYAPEDQAAKEIFEAEREEKPEPKEEKINDVTKTYIQARTSLNNFLNSQS